MPNLPAGQSSRYGDSQALSVVVLVSGTGTNLQAILDRFRGSPEVEVVGVASNKPDAPALARAKREDVPTETFARTSYGSRAERDEAMAQWIKARGAQLVVLAGYMEILSPRFVNQFQASVINIHPSLLPAFPGLNSIERAYSEGVAESGVTIHIVDEGVDTGPVIVQHAVRLRQGEGLHEFERRIHEVEHELLPAVVARFAKGRQKARKSPRNFAALRTRKSRRSTRSRAIASAR